MFIALQKGKYNLRINILARELEGIKFKKNTLLFFQR